VNCKNDAGSCQCWEHHRGLSAYSTDPVAYTAALTSCRPSKVVLSVLTKDDILSIETACDHTMTCACRTCSSDRAARKKQTQPQPWQPRAPRQRAA